MKVDSKAKILAFGAMYPGPPPASVPLLAWEIIARNADWQNPQELKSQISSASILKAGIVIFNISGNNYRLITKMDFQEKIIDVRWFGTHAEYNQIDPYSV